MEKCDYFDTVDLTSLTDKELLSLYKDIENLGDQTLPTDTVRYGFPFHCNQFDDQKLAG